MEHDNEFMAIVIDNASAVDLDFIVKGMFEICNIERQVSDPRNTLIKQAKKAIKGEEILVARDKAKIVGFIQFVFAKKNPYGLDYGNYNKKYCWIEWMYVRRGYRRKGIGKRLQENVIAVCKKHKVKEIMLDVFDVNKNARKFYEEEKFCNFIHILKEKVR
jgi:GNAT superfamily N-acetyltransferase